jgi:hypothetical protein
MLIGGRERHVIMVSLSAAVRHVIDSDGVIGREAGITGPQPVSPESEAEVSAMLRHRLGMKTVAWNSDQAQWWNVIRRPEGGVEAVAEKDEFAVTVADLSSSWFVVGLSEDVGEDASLITVVLVIHGHFLTGSLTNRMPGG